MLTCGPSGELLGEAPLKFNFVVLLSATASNLELALDKGDDIILYKIIW